MSDLSKLNATIEELSAKVERLQQGYQPVAGDDQSAINASVKRLAEVVASIPGTSDSKVKAPEQPEPVKKAGDSKPAATTSGHKPASNLK